MFQEGFLAPGSAYLQRLLALHRNGIVLLSSPVTVAGPLRLLTAFRSPETGPIFNYIILNEQNSQVKMLFCVVIDRSRRNY
jgi:hypothetical protein